MDTEELGALLASTADHDAALPEVDVDLAGYDRVSTFNRSEIRKTRLFLSSTAAREPASDCATASSSC